MDELKLYYFRSVCRHLSFTRAAKACNVVQSTISKQIAALEDELGVKLFHRQSKGIQLTPAGRRLLANADAYANQYRAINASVRRLMMARTDSITVGVGQYEADLILEPLKVYSERYPEIEVNCMYYAYSNLVSFWASGTLDVAIGTELCAKKFRSKASVELLTAKWMVAAHKDSPFWGLDADKRRRLEGQLVITTISNEYEPVRPYCINNRLDQGAFTHTNTYASQLLMLRANMGIALLPSFLKPSMPEDVIMEDVLDPPLALRFVAMYDAETCSEATTKFIQLCKEKLRLVSRVDDGG